MTIDMNCKECYDKGKIRYYYDAGDHFSAHPSPKSEWRYRYCDCEIGKRLELMDDQRSKDIGGNAPLKRTKKVKVDVWIAFYIAHGGRIFTSTYIYDPPPKEEMAKRLAFGTYITTKKATVELEIPEDG